MSLWKFAYLFKFWCFWAKGIKRYFNCSIDNYFLTYLSMLCENNNNIKIWKIYKTLLWIFLNSKKMCWSASDLCYLLVIAIIEFIKKQIKRIRRNEEKKEMKLFVLEESNKIDLEKIVMKSFGKKMRMLKNCGSEEYN